MWSPRLCFRSMKPIWTPMFKTLVFFSASPSSQSLRLTCIWFLLLLGWSISAWMDIECVFFATSLVFPIALRAVLNLMSSLYFQLKMSSRRHYHPKKSSEMEACEIHPTPHPNWWGKTARNSYLHLLSFFLPPLLPHIKNEGREWKKRLLDGFWKAEVFILSACQQLMIELKKISVMKNSLKSCLKNT